MTPRPVSLEVVTPQQGDIGKREYVQIVVDADPPLRVFVFRGVPQPLFHEYRDAFKKANISGLALNLPKDATFELFEEKPA